MHAKLSIAGIDKLTLGVVNEIVVVDAVVVVVVVEVAVVLVVVVEVAVVLVVVVLSPSIISK